MQNEIRYCYSCGSPLANAGDVFCVRCGARQFTSQQPPKQSKPNAGVSFLKGLAYVALFFGIQLIVSFGAQIVIMATIDVDIVSGDFVTAMYSEIGRWSWLCGIIEAVILFGFLLIFFKARHKKISEEIKIRSVSPAALGGCAVCGLGAQFAAVILLTIIYAFLPYLANFSVSDELANMLSAPNPLLDFMYIAVITPLMEETVFRGLVYTRLRRSMSAGAAIVLCGIIFGAAHMNIEQFLYAAPLGMLMAAVYEKYGSLWAPFTIHFAFNGGNYLTGYLPESPEMLVPALAVIGTGLMLITIAFMLCTNKNTPAIESKGNSDR